MKLDPITALIKSENGTLLFTGKIISVTRHVSKGFTRGDVILSSIPREGGDGVAGEEELWVEFENENLNAMLKAKGKEDRLLAICPDLITVRFLLYFRS